MKFLLSLLSFLFLLSGGLFGQDSLFSEGQVRSVIPNPDWIEISGMAVGKDHPDWIYIHNDSGGENAVYILSTDGKDVGKVSLEGVSNRDWEDIAVGPGPNGQSYVYVAEIGDNLARHSEIMIYRFPEPKTSSSQVVPEKATYVYPEGAMDSEAIMVDPVSGCLFLISKRNSENTIFEMPMQAFSRKEPMELIQFGNLPFTSTVAADISQDGASILVKTYFAVYYWDRDPLESIPETLAKPFIQLPYNPEPQGEAVAFQADGMGYYTLSEERFDIKPVLYYYIKRD